MHLAARSLHPTVPLHCVLLQAVRSFEQLWKKGKSKDMAFFPRVRTPCGHGAQVIVEGREIQSDGGEKDKENPTTKQPPTTAHRPSLHHPVVFPLCKVKQVKRKLLTIDGPEFSNEEHGSAGLCSGKVSSLSSNGLHISIAGDQRPRCGKNMVSMQVRSVDLLQRRLYPYHGSGVAVHHAVEKTILVAQPIQLVALTSTEAQ